MRISQLTASILNTAIDNNQTITVFYDGLSYVIGGCRGPSMYSMRCDQLPNENPLEVDSISDLKARMQLNKACRKEEQQQEPTQEEVIEEIEAEAKNPIIDGETMINTMSVIACHIDAQNYAKGTLAYYIEQLEYNAIEALTRHNKAVELIESIDMQLVELMAGTIAIG